MSDKEDVLALSQKIQIALSGYAGNTCITALLKVVAEVAKQCDLIEATINAAGFLAISLADESEDCHKLREIVKEVMVGFNEKTVKDSIKLASLILALNLISEQDSIDPAIMQSALLLVIAEHASIHSLEDSLMGKMLFHVVNHNEKIMDSQEIAEDAINKIMKH